MKLSYSGMHKLSNVHVAELHRLIVCSRLKYDLVIPRKRPVHIDLHIVEISERRHRPDFTVRKESFELLLGSESDMASSKDVFEPFDIYFPIGWQHRHHKPLSYLKHHYFREV